jgi:hypothetical protein
MADDLSEDQAAIDDAERVEMLALVVEMQMDDRVARALAFCPPSA